MCICERGALILGCWRDTHDAEEEPDLVEGATGEARHGGNVFERPERGQISASDFARVHVRARAIIGQWSLSVVPGFVRMSYRSETARIPSRVAAAFRSRLDVRSSYGSCRLADRCGIGPRQSACDRRPVLSDKK